MGQSRIARVIVDAPFDEPLDYKLPEELKLEVGQRCLVPLGRRKVVGIVVGFAETSVFPEEKLKSIQSQIDDVPALSKKWLNLTCFAARYYLSSWGQVALASLPLFFRRQPGPRHELSLNRLRKESNLVKSKKVNKPILNAEQADIIDRFNLFTGFHVGLLFGVTGSGKTEVYLNLMDKVFSEDSNAQVLLMVPEINLTPQLLKTITNRFPDKLARTWNSSMAEAKKAQAWLDCHEGRARILVGTRLSIFASFQNLKLIVVDEEHDTSFKAQEGVRYSSRDLAIKKAQIENIPILLGSATPSLETYKNAIEGKYELYVLPNRAIKESELPTVELVDIRKEKLRGGISEKTYEEISRTLSRGEQVIIFLNRRGYAPVVECRDCGWTSQCPHCSAYAVFHKTIGQLVCHHCGWHTPLPKACPKCGSMELSSVGRGTQKAEEEIASLWPEARIVRLDHDSSRAKGSADKVLESVHQGTTDILVGTQIVAKGHDFQNVSLVVVLNTDPQLLSGDYRAREWLFSVLMQVAGRAGRTNKKGKVLIQTKYKEDPLYSDLISQNYSTFAVRELDARRTGHLPPFSAQALIVSESANINRSIEKLNQIKELINKMRHPAVRAYDPVPLSLYRLKDIERGQLLVESNDKKTLQRFLSELTREMKQLKLDQSTYIDVDPLSF